MKNNTLIIGINSCDNGSTGNMMINSLEYAHKNGHFDVIAFVPFDANINNPVKTISFGHKRSFVHKCFYRFLRELKFPVINDGNYYHSFTKRLIKTIKKESNNYLTTIIHIHNLHDCNVNINYFYRWLTKTHFKVLYTLHDCWSFTGGCYVYDYIKCNGWQKDCKNCPQHIKYSASQLKKRTSLLNAISDLSLITVSNWAAEEVKKSKLKNIPLFVNLGETSLVPSPNNTIPNLKEKICGYNKKMLLFVSAYWNDWKGVSYIYKISDLLPDGYVSVVVGPFNTWGHNKIIQVNNIGLKELPYYYSIADVYVSVTQSDQLGLTTCEAQMCGTPIVGFGNGGSKETFIDGKTGILVENNNIDKLVEAIIYVVEKHPFKREDVIENGNRFKKYEHARRQLALYEEVIKKNNQ